MGFILETRINGILYITIFYSTVEILIFSMLLYYKTSQGKDSSKQNGSLNNIEKYNQTDLNIDPDSRKVADLSKINRESLTFNKDILNDLYCPKKTEDTIEDGLSLVVNDMNSKIENTHRYDLMIFNVNLNDIRKINKTLIKFYGLINDGGFLVLPYKDLELVEDDIKVKSFFLMKTIKMFSYYVLRRAWPKIPLINKFYFSITKGKNRVMSRTEVWGRLSYCGFEIVKEIEKNGITYLIAQKMKTISDNPNPSYSPLITLNRVSLNGNIVKINKIRSMCPFS
ncbi:hypothetical protein K8R66_02525, partial [bacterium]|nr:hypothetical protein [bacterium]